MFSYNKQYIDGLTKTYGFHKEYQFKGKKCNKDCKHLINYETIHSKECPFYDGSFSQHVNFVTDMLACLLHIYQDKTFGDLVWRLSIEEICQKLIEPGRDADYKEYDNYRY